MNLKRPREGRKVLILLFVFRKMHLKERTRVKIFRVLHLFSFFFYILFQALAEHVSQVLLGRSHFFDPTCKLYSLASNVHTKLNYTVTRRNLSPLWSLLLCFNTLRHISSLEPSYCTGYVEQRHWHESPRYRKRVLDVLR